MSQTNKNKKLSTEVTIIAKLSVILLIVLYVIVTFVEMEVDPREWMMLSRVVYCLLSVVGIGYITRNLLKA